MTESQHIEWKESCRAKGVPKPTLRFDVGAMWTEFIFDQVYMERLAGLRKGENMGSDQVTDQVTDQVEKWVIDALKACLTPKKSSEIQAVIGLKHRITFQRNYLDKLLEEGLLAMTIPEKPNSRLQKYQLTEKGKILLTLHGKEA